MATLNKIAWDGQSPDKVNLYKLLSQRSLEWCANVKIAAKNCLAMLRCRLSFSKPKNLHRLLGLAGQALDRSQNNYPVFADRETRAISLRPTTTRSSSESAVSSDWVNLWYFLQDICIDTHRWSQAQATYLYDMIIRPPSRKCKVTFQATVSSHEQKHLVFPLIILHLLGVSRDALPSFCTQYRFRWGETGLLQICPM